MPLRCLVVGNHPAVVREYLGSVAQAILAMWLLTTSKQPYFPYFPQYRRYEIHAFGRIWAIDRRQPFVIAAATGAAGSERELFRVQWADFLELNDDGRRGEAIGERERGGVG